MSWFFMSVYAVGDTYSNTKFGYDEGQKDGKQIIR